MTPIFAPRIPEYNAWKAEREAVAARKGARTVGRAVVELVALILGLSAVVTVLGAVIR